MHANFIWVCDRRPDYTSLTKLVEVAELVDGDVYLSLPNGVESVVDAELCDRKWSRETENVYRGSFSSFRTNKDTLGSSVEKSKICESDFWVNCVHAYSAWSYRTVNQYVFFLNGARSIPSAKDVEAFFKQRKAHDLKGRDGCGFMSGTSTDIEHHFANLNIVNGTRLDNHVKSVRDSVQVVVMEKEKELAESTTKTEDYKTLWIVFMTLFIVSFLMNLYLLNRRRRLRYMEEDIKTSYTNRKQ